MDTQSFIICTLVQKYNTLMKDAAIIHLGQREKIDVQHIVEMPDLSGSILCMALGFTNEEMTEDNNPIHQIDQKFFEVFFKDKKPMDIDTLTDTAEEFSHWLKAFKKDFRKTTVKSR